MISAAQAATVTHSMDWGWIAAAIGAVFGAGGLVGFLKLRTERLKLLAEAEALKAEAVKSKAEALAVEASTMQGRYDKLFEDLQQEIARMHELEDKCRATLAETVETLNDMRQAAISAEEAAKAARAQVIILEDRMAQMERIQETAVSSQQALKDTVQEILVQAGAFPLKKNGERT